jgi:hypothetical protein
MLITYYSHLHTFTANKVPNALFQASTYVALGVNFPDFRPALMSLWELIFTVNSFYNFYQKNETTSNNLL